MSEKVDDLHGEIPTEIRGVRSFRADELGRLTGLFYRRQVWVPGENTAMCRRAESSNYLLNVTTTTTGWRPQMPDPVHISEGHMESCTCGFHAFYYSDDYRKSSSVSVISGVISGFGQVVKGSAGFRAEHARIVALCVNDMEDPLVVRNYRHSGIALHASYTEMLRRWIPAAIGPAEDPDFWTRAV